MIVIFEKGEQIIIHQSGKVTRYKQAQLESYRTLLIRQRAENEFKINAINRDIAQLISSKGVK